MALHAYVVADVFTERPLEGNQLAVFPDGGAVPEELMQATARELNLSETVFVLPPTGGADALIRIFTPDRELPFAGHPVLGSAVVLGEQRGLETIRLETGSGVVPVELRRDGEAVFGRMAQPLPTWEPYARADELLRAVGVERSGLPVELYRNGPGHVYVELGSEDAVAALRPDLDALASHEGIGANCFAGSGTRWKTRMFGPGIGIPEDPAAGSAAGPLAVHLARHGRIRFGDEIEISQGAELLRPSVLYARADGSAERLERVTVGGNAVVVGRGEYRLA